MTLIQGFARPAAVALLCLLSACAPRIVAAAPANSLPHEVEQDELDDAPLPLFAGLRTIQERWLSERDEADNVDSLATWHGPNGEHWLLATAKETDRLLVYDAGNGRPLRKFGASGSGPGQFDRPNGISVIDDLVFVVERDNHRVQVLRLPDFEPLLRFGAGDLIKPYGLWVQPTADGYRVYVTDNYENPDESIPPPDQLDRRVKRYQLSREADAWTATLDLQFGDTGRGALLIVESIWGDAASGQLLIADEEQYQQRNIKVYDLDGRYSGHNIGGGVFRDQPEGIALYACEDDSGYWFATDQSKQHNVFHLFDRNSHEYLGSFEGAVTLNTDGVWLDRRPQPGFSQGAFYAVHNDGNAAAFDLGEILSALELKRCD